MTSSRVPKAPTSTVGLALGAAAVTCAVYLPQLLTDAGDQSQGPPAVWIAWLAALLLAPPVVAGVLATRGRASLPAARALLVGLPQLPVALLLARLDVWLEVRSGYLLAGSGEEAMAYGISGVVSAVGGLVLVVLVAFGAWLGSARGRRGSVTALEPRDAVTP